MKSVLAGLLVAVFGWSAQALELRDVVMVEDFSDTPVYTSFPCTVYIDVLNCDSRLVLEKGCRASLETKGDVYSCRSLKGDRVDFARVDRSKKIDDETMGGVRGYRMIYSDRVQLNRFVSPNGNEEFQLVVE